MARLRIRCPAGTDCGGKMSAAPSGSGPAAGTDAEHWPLEMCIRDRVLVVHGIESVPGKAVELPDQNHIEDFLRAVLYLSLIHI